MSRARIGTTRRVEIIRSVSGKGASSDDGIGGVGRGASERFHCRGTSNRGIMGIVWYWISIQTATSSGPIRATSSALGTARNLPSLSPRSLPFRIFVLCLPVYWILSLRVRGFCTLQNSQTFPTRGPLTRSVNGLDSVVHEMSFALSSRAKVSTFRGTVHEHSVVTKP